MRLRYFPRDLYTHRRKNLRGALLGFHGRPFTKPDVDAKPAEIGIDADGPSFADPTKTSKYQDLTEVVRLRSAGKEAEVRTDASVQRGTLERSPVHP